MTTKEWVEFRDAYVECALWSSDDDDGDPLLGSYASKDLTPESMQRMTCDCNAFLDECDHTIRAAIDADAVVVPTGSNAWMLAGHDFWLTRNGHGSGFWDGDWSEPYASRLTEAAKRCKECCMLVDGDKLVLI